MNNQIIVTSQNRDSLNLTINTTSGEIQGNFSIGSVSNFIESVILQNEQIARGYFSAAGQSGSFLLVANAAFDAAPPFPAFTAVAVNGATVVGTVTPAGITNLVFPRKYSHQRCICDFFTPRSITEGSLDTPFTVATTSSHNSVVDCRHRLRPQPPLLYTEFQPGGQVFDSNITVTVTAKDGFVTNTFTINTTILFVNEPPSFTWRVFRPGTW